jgi:hypothetical protein
MQSTPESRASPARGSPARPGPRVSPAHQAVSPASHRATPPDGPSPSRPVPSTATRHVTETAPDCPDSAASSSPVL